MRKLILTILAIVLSGSGCRAPAPAPATALPPAESQAAPLPTTAQENPPAAPTLAAATPAPLPTLPPGPLTAPVVLNRYPLTSSQSESLAAGAGRVWVGTSAGAIEEYDSQSGALLRTYPLVENTGGRLAPVRELAFDGQRLWAVVEWSNGDLDLVSEIVAFDPAAGSVLFRVNAGDNQPEKLGFAPGQVWAQNLVLDPATGAQLASFEMTSDSTAFAYDEAGRLWAGGTLASPDGVSCLTVYNLNDYSAQPGPAYSGQIRLLQTAGGKLWAVSAFNRLDGYDLSAALQPETEPAAGIDLSPQMQAPPLEMLSDGQYLWLLSGPGGGGGTLYQHDPNSGRNLSALAVADADGEGAALRTPVDLAFDGRDLWVLTALDIARVALPWTRD